MESVGLLSFPERAIEGYSNDFLDALSPARDVDGQHARRHRLRLRKRIAHPAADPEQSRRRDDRAQRVFRQRERCSRLRETALATSISSGTLRRRWVRRSGSLLDQHGEALALVDDRGRIIEKSRLLAL